MKKFTHLISVLISILASIGIAYFTEKENGLLSALCGIMNVIPLIMNTPAGLLMPLEVVQAVVFHVIQCGRVNAGPKKTWLHRVLTYDTKGNTIMAIVAALGTFCAWSAPINIRSKQYWEKFEGSMGPLAWPTFIEKELSSFDENKKGVVFLENIDDYYKIEEKLESAQLSEEAEVFINVGTQAYKRMLMKEATEQRWLNKSNIPMTSWGLTLLHVIFSLWLVLFYKKELSFTSSHVWLLIAVLGSGILLHVHAGSLIKIYEEESVLHLPSLVSVIVGFWWFVVSLGFVPDNLYVNEKIKTVMPVMFIFFTALNGLYYNDEYYAMEEPNFYVGGLVLMVAFMVIYSIVKKPAPTKKKEIDLLIPLLTMYKSK